MKRILTALLLVTLSAPATAAVSVNGRYLTDEKDSIIEIGQCGAVVCGKVARILKPTPNGKPAVDSNNPDPKLRNRPILGMTLLSGFKDAGKEWAGQIYDPRRGKVFKSTMVKLANGNLRVKGCVAFFCQSVIFTPAP
jgi:uncharacterized protein (DUF2147 family)